MIAAEPASRPAVALTSVAAVACAAETVDASPPRGDKVGRAVDGRLNVRGRGDAVGLRRRTPSRCRCWLS